MSRVRHFLSGLKRELNLKEPFFKYTGQRGIDNLWTGYEAGGPTKAVIALGTVSYGGYQAWNLPYQAMGAQAELQDVESLPGTRGDQTGYLAYGGQVGPGLQVTGDLVFALHKLRHGG
jgi:hypothetical protein